ncbi:HvfC family RiPP maturation protein [Moraxella oblonga]|uniref:HvfC family RiPP maturation protein n=1 Tax=Moraxella oblonga TaxID=200413 RepID=UPI000834622C|nr:putative DNA-binding domain-containing protein [Moraxella oblonga]
MPLMLFAPHSLKKFQNEFGDYLRSQRQNNGDNIPTRVGKIYQDLIFNNVCGFLNQCFPICKSIMGENWRTLCLYFFQRYPTHSPYFTEIPMQFVEFLSQMDDGDFDKSVWLNELTLSHDEIKKLLPAYLSELAHYEWLELHTETFPNQANKLILNDVQSYYLNNSVQNHYYLYPVHKISENVDIALENTFLVVLRHNDKVKFVEINLLTYLFLEFITNNQTIYQDKNTLLADFANSIDYQDVDGLIKFGDELLQMLVNNHILFN